MTVKINDKIEESKALFAQAQALLQQETLDAADQEKADELMAEAQKLKTQAGQLKAIQDHLAVMPDPQTETKNGGTQVPTRPTRFGSFGDYVKALRDEHMSKGRVVDTRLMTFTDAEDGGRAGRGEEKDLSSAVGAAGGYLMQDEHYDEVMAVAAPLSIVRPRAQIIPMGSRNINLPILDQTGTSGTGGGFFGGIIAYWQAEAATIAKSEPSFREATLTAHELVAYAPIPNSLLEDANVVSLTAFLAGSFGFPGAIAWKEDYAFLRGNGNGQPQGIVNAPASIVVSRNTASTVVYDDLVAMLVRGMGMNRVWVAHQMILEKLLLMTGPSGNPVYLWGDATKGVPNTLLGLPIVFVDKLPAVGSKGDIVLADLSYYIIGDRKRTTVDFSTDFLFRTNQVAARAVHRVDGQPWLSAPITFTDGSTQISPFVVLGAAST